MTPPSVMTEQRAPRQEERAAPEARPKRRWHTHGWNRPISWELILRVIPRLPRFLLVPLHHVTTSLCFVLMPRERAAARRNLRRVTGAAGLAGLRLAYRLFFNFSRFMVAYVGLRDLEVDRFKHRLAGVREAEEALQRVIDAGRGGIVATMHIGHWDLGLKLMSRFDVPVHVVMLNEDPAGVSRYADEARAIPGLRVHQMGGSPLLAVELMAALRRGELVAIQADRPVGGNVMTVEFFGAPAELPTGPAQLAMATGAPVLPIFVLFEGWDRYRLLALPPLRFERPPRGAPAEAALREAIGRMARMMESVASRYPDQWFNFYDVWPVAGRGGRV